MKTVLEVMRDGLTPIRVFHRNASDRCWVHSLEERADCGACQGTSTAAPTEKEHK